MSQQVALITGGTTGIGRATAIAFGRAGAKVVVTGRREAEGRETERLVQELGVEALFVRADASDEADMRRVVDATLTRFGRLDAAFNNAGVEGATIAPIADQSVDDFERVMAINVRGVFLSMKHEIPAMLRSGG
ncbi:MAG: SDR family NAD(P)-dependent oxidoreductase, partial [Planctomycetes bacterium]|nr:SDR family NAD(P)-dependent oxidoreductase [Planctomycetota bacterium]